MQNPLCGNLILCALSVRLLEKNPYIQRSVIVFLNIQTSRSIVDAPWAEMMCKIAFFGGMQAGRGRHHETDTSQAALADCLNEKSPSIQPRSQAHGILFCLGSCSDYWAGMAHTHQHTHKHKHTLAPHTNTQRPKAELWYYERWLVFWWESHLRH